MKEIARGKWTAPALDNASAATHAVIVVAIEAAVGLTSA
jgi:hypothetical protein